MLFTPFANWNTLFFTRNENIVLCHAYNVIKTNNVISVSAAE